jgi:hypothetical protein
MNITCVQCKAFHWLAEHVKSSKTNPRFSHCCHHGKVHLPHLRDPPQPLLSLFTAPSTEGKQFWESIHQYNSALAFTSFTVKQQDVNSSRGGPWVWKTGYTIYHCAGTLFPNIPATPSYSQLYYFDPDDALAYRMNRNDHVKQDTMHQLQDMLLHCNHYALMFAHAFDILQRTPTRDLGIHILADPSTDLRRYNAPTIDEIAVILPGNQDQAMNPHDIILHSHGGQLHFIHDHHVAYVPLHYVLLFPYSSDGWTYDIPIHVSTDFMTDDDSPNNSEHRNDNDAPNDNDVLNNAPNDNDTSNNNNAPSDDHETPVQDNNTTNDDKEDNDAQNDSPNNHVKEKHVTQVQYYSYHLHT